MRQKKKSLKSSSEANWTGSGWSAASLGHGRETAEQGTPGLLTCSGAPEPHEWEEWELLCVFVTPLSSRTQEATAVTILEDRQSPARRIAERGLWQREERGHSEQKKKVSQPLPHPQFPDCVPDLLAGVLSHSRP